MTLAQALEKSGRCGFVPFVTAEAASAKYARILKAEGADILELGVPFSDPVADGPTIQAASERALKAGMTLKKALALAGKIYAAGGPPVIIFTYLNPILRLGREAFARLCRANHVKGVLIVDLPAEEWAPWKALLEKFEVEPVLLASPTTTDERLRLIGKLSGSVVYYVSREGVTGVRQGTAPKIGARLRHVARITAKPLMAGFGVATAQQARALAPHCAGVVVGSALVAAAHEGGAKGLARAARGVVAGLRR